MRNLGNVHHLFNIEWGKIYLVKLNNFFMDIHVFIPTENFKYKHLCRNRDTKVWSTYEGGDATSTLRIDLHGWFVKENQFSHDRCLYELESEEELEKFIFMEELTA